MSRTRSRIRLVCLAVLVLAGLAPVLPGNAAPGPAFTTLQPGKPARLTEKVPIQVVMVGYEPAQIDDELFRYYVPETTRPVDRRRMWREGKVVELGLEYTYDFKLHYADAAYEDAFFGHLANIGVDEMDLTGNDVSAYQSLYNLQPGRALDIVNNLVINPAEVERWLVEHPAPGMDASRDTLVLINWWGRPDFRFHEYEMTGDPQSETGVDFGMTYWHTRLMAWGGTGAHDEETGFGRESRTWFHDLSAGPNANTGGWVIDDNLGFGPDPSFHTIFPPTWEYLTGHAQDRWSLTEALGVIMRFVAINMLFTPSPIYGHDLDARMPSDVELDVTIQGDIGKPLFTPSLLQQELGELLGAAPRLDVESRPLAGTERKCLEAFANNERCRPQTDPAIYDVDADLYLGAEATQSQWRDGSAEYEAPAFIHASESRKKWIGVALDNETDGTRTAVFSLPTSRIFDLGYGPTSVLVHEYGHHFGVSHSHDGYEGTWGQYNYAANNTESGIFYFAWAGTEVSSVMSYLDLNNDFSQFDLDNYRRWQATRYLRAANMISADVLASKRAAAGVAALTRADAAFTAAQQALTAHDYVTAERGARDGYAAVREAADNTGTSVPASDAAWTLTKPGKGNARKAHDTPDPAADPIDQKRTDAAVPAKIGALG